MRLSINMNVILHQPHSSISIKEMCNFFLSVVPTIICINFYTGKMTKSKCHGHLTYFDAFQLSLNDIIISVPYKNIILILIYKIICFNRLKESWSIRCFFRLFSLAWCVKIRLIWITTNNLKDYLIYRVLAWILQMKLAQNVENNFRKCVEMKRFFLKVSNLFLDFLNWKILRLLKGFKDKIFFHISRFWAERSINTFSRFISNYSMISPLCTHVRIWVN